jgi:hypothetical protein
MPIYLQISRQGMRRPSALLLILLSVAPWLLALSSSDAIAEGSLPVCCRARGTHKCFMRLSKVADAPLIVGQPAVSHVSERCPYNRTWTNTPHSEPFGQPAKDGSGTALKDATSLIGVATLICIPLQSRANCKRGPPSPALPLEITADRLAARPGLPFFWRHDASIETDSPISCSDASRGPDHTG